MDEKVPLNCPIINFARISRLFRAVAEPEATFDEAIGFIVATFTTVVDVTGVGGVVAHLSIDFNCIIRN